MSRPSAGNYIIYNRVLSQTGQKLAITFNGDNQYPTVEPFGNSKHQVVRNTSHLFSPYLLCHYSY